MVYRLILIVLLFVFNGCSKHTEYFYSPDKADCITIVTEDNVRYIIAGYSDIIPKSNYIKIHKGYIGSEVGDQIIGCWNRDGFKWVILMDQVSILENKLDSKMFNFKKDFPQDNSSIPTLKDYNTELKNCFSIGLEYGEVIAIEGDIKK